MHEDRNDAPIVVGVDGSEPALAAVRWAAAEAVRRDLPLRLVHAYVVPTRGYPSGVVTVREIRTGMERRASGWLDDAASAAKEQANEVRVETATRAMDSVAALLAESRHARMVVVGSSGLGGFTGMLLGSNATALAVHARCTVVVARGSTQGSGPVVVGMDGSEGGDAAMGFAFGQARLRGTSVLAVHAWHAFTPDPAMRMPGARVDWSELEPETAGELDRQLRRWQQACPDVRVDHVVVRGRAKPIMLEAARRGQLLVLGRRGRGGFPGMLLGSVVRAAIHHAVCPVAVVGTRELGRAPQPSPEDPGAAAAQDGAGG